jgi:ABC-type sugar transport system substrate-binding protein
VGPDPAIAAAVGGGDLLAEELRAVLDGVADAVTVQTPDQRLVYAN